MKYSMKDSYIYDILNIDRTIAKIGSNVNNNLDDYKLQTDGIISDIKRKTTITNKQKVIRDVEEGKLVLISAPGITLPSWCVAQGSDVIGVANLFSKLKVKGEGDYRYQIKEVAGLIVVAFVLRNFFLKEKSFLYTNRLITNLAVVYSRIFMRVLDTMFSINSMGNEKEAQFIEYMIIKFFYHRVVESSFSSKDAENSTYANVMKKSKKTSSIMYNINTHAERAEQYPAETFESIDSLCKELADTIPTLSRLETNVFIRKLIYLLGEKAVLMLESPQYLIAYVTSSAFSTNLIKDFQMASIAGSELLVQISNDVMNITVD